MLNSSENNLLPEIRRIVWKRKWLIAIIFSLVVISGAIATFLITPKYEAQMSVIISRQRNDPQVSPGEKSADVLLTGITDEEFNSELELIKNSEVLAGAVKRIDLVNNQSPKQDDFSSRLRQKVKLALRDFAGLESEETSTVDEFAKEKLTDRLAANLSVEPVKKSRIIKVAYTDTDPVRARTILEAIYEEYLDLHVRMNEKSPITNIFDRQSEDFAKKLKNSTDAIKNFDQKNAVTGVEANAQSELLLKQYYETKAQADRAATEIDETEKRIGVLKEKIADQPQQIQTGSVSKYVGALDGMKNELIGLRQEKTRLLQKYKPNARFVVEIEDRISNLEKAIANETANPPQEKSFALNDLRRSLESELATAQISLAALKTRARELKDQSTRQRAEADRLNLKSIEREQFERERKINEEAYLLYQKKARESEVSEVLNRQQVLNVGLADPPRSDGEKKSPKTLLNLLVLVNLGLFAGFACALLAEKFSPRPGVEVETLTILEPAADVPLLPQEVRAIPASREQSSAPPVRKISAVSQENPPRVRRMSQVTRETPKRVKTISTITRETPDHTEVIAVRCQTFVVDERDEKLSEIANYFKVNKQNSAEERG